jgi:hypothetical protein
VTKRIGRDPGTLDIVITMANFSTTFPLATDADSGEQRCDPRSTTDEYDGRQLSGWEKKLGKKFDRLQCDRMSTRPCCVKTQGAAWGKCVAPDASKYGAGGCACADCFDYRIRDRAFSFVEVRNMLRGFEENGLHTKSTKHPDGVLGKIFIVYNAVNGNGRPLWLTATPNVIAVSHTEMWKDVSQLPIANRNSISANVHRIKGLGEWYLVLQDDMFLQGNLAHWWIRQDLPICFWQEP